MAYGYRPSYPTTRIDLGTGDQPPGPAGPRPAPSPVRLAALTLSIVGLGLIGTGVLAGYLGVTGGDGLDHGRASDLVGTLVGIGLGGGAVYVFGGLVLLAFARRIRRGGRVARAVVVGVSALLIGSTLYTGLVGPGGANALFGLVLPVILLVLLYMPAARSWYRDRTY